MHRFIRIMVALAFLVALASAASAVIGKPASAGVDPCATVVPTEDVATFTPTLVPGVTETVDSSTVTMPADTETPTEVPTNTEIPATETPTTIPTNTEVPATNTPAGIPTTTFPPIDLVENGLANSNRVLNQIVDCETPGPVATSPVTNLPNTGTGTTGHTTSIAMILLLFVIGAAISMRARHAFRR
ncbi:MAG TPA: hypothetical protein PK819_00435 [Thermomicrobiales bacterium]|nr:hypothetical protein [Thermomicrobiales bacterium]